MKKILFTNLLLFTVVVYSQTTVTKTLDDFSILKVYNGIEVVLIKSKEQKMEISGEKSTSVIIKNTDNTLKISLPFSLNPDKNISDKAILVSIYYNKNIAIVDANEGSTITANEFTQDALEVKAQEGALVNMVVALKYVTVKASSGGIIKLTGTTKNQQVDLDLYGIYHGFNLKCSSNTSVKAASGAKAEVFAGEILDAKVSFGGSIFYKGDPEILNDKKVMGGIIQKRN